MPIEIKLEAIVLTCNFGCTALWELCEEQSNLHKVLILWAIYIE